MPLENQPPAPPVVLTVVLRPGQPARATDDHPATGGTPAAPAAPARPAAPEEEPTWEDAAWY